MKKVLFFSWLIFFLFSAFAFAQVIVEPSFLAFEETVNLRTSTTELIISNNQEETQIISGIRMVGEGADRFLIEREAFALGQGETRSIRIQFLPDTIGDF